MCVKQIKMSTKIIEKIDIIRVVTPSEFYFTIENNELPRIINKHQLKQLESVLKIHCEKKIQQNQSCTQNKIPSNTTTVYYLHNISIYIQVF